MGSVQSRLRGYMIDNNISLSDLAEASGQAWIAERKFVPHFDRLDQVEVMARVVRVSPGWLAFGAPSIGDAPAESPDEPLLVLSLQTRLRAARKQRHLSRAALAERSEAKIDDIGKMEVGRIPGSWLLTRIAKVLQVPPEWLAFGQAKGLAEGEIPATSRRPPPPPARVVEMTDVKARLAAGLARMRKKRGANYADFARRIGSSPNRVKQLEEAAESVTIDAYFRVYFALGITAQQLGRRVSGPAPAREPKSRYNEQSSPKS